MSSFRIRKLTEADASIAVPALAEVLTDCVAGGASVSFMADLTDRQARDFWRQQLEAGDGRTILVAEDDGGIFGVVQLVPAWPPNQPHRADVSKLLVHRRARGRGAARALMQELEKEAAATGRWLLVLDAVTGGPAAKLYESLGWVKVGDVPEFALMPDGALCGTTYYYRRLR